MSLSVAAALGLRSLMCESGALARFIPASTHFPLLCPVALLTHLAEHQRVTREGQMPERWNLPTNVRIPSGRLPSPPRLRGSHRVGPVCVRAPKPKHRWDPATADVGDVGRRHSGGPDASHWCPSWQDPCLRPQSVSGCGLEGLKVVRFQVRWASAGLQTRSPPQLSAQVTKALKGIRKGRRGRASAGRRECQPLEDPTAHTAFPSVAFQPQARCTVNMHSAAFRDVGLERSCLSSIYSETRQVQEEPSRSPYYRDGGQLRGQRKVSDRGSGEITKS